MKRQLLHESVGFRAWGRPDLLLLEFTTPALVSNSRLYHESVGHVLKFAPMDPPTQQRLIGDAQCVYAIAIMRGRGVFAKVGPGLIDPPRENPTIRGYKAQRKPNAEEHTASGRAPAIVVPWVAWVEFSRCAENTFGYFASRNFHAQSLNKTESRRGPQAVDRAFEEWHRFWGWADIDVFGSRFANRSIIMSEVVDGLTPTLWTRPPEGTPKARALALAVVSLSIERLALDYPTEIEPVEYSQAYRFISIGPSQRRLMRRGGIRAYVKAVSGLDGPAAVRAFRPRLLEAIHKTTVAANMINAALEGDFPEERVNPITGNLETRPTREERGIPGKANMDALLMRKFLETLAPDHRIALLEMAGRYTAQPMTGPNDAVAFATIFSLVDRKKLLRLMRQEQDAIFAALESYKGGGYMVNADGTRNEIPVPTAYEGMHVADCFSHVREAGRMLWDWSKRELNERQRKVFPNGLQVKRKWQTLKELHDQVSRDATRLEELGSAIKLRWDEPWSKLHGRRAGDLRILLPRSTATVVRWGTAQKHCVSSYAKKMLQPEDRERYQRAGWVRDAKDDPRTVIFGVFRGSELQYCGRLEFEEPGAGPFTPDAQIEEHVKDWRLMELRGVNNRAPGREDFLAVASMVTAAGLRVPADFSNRMG